MLRYYKVTFLDKQGKEVLQVKTWGETPRDAVLRLPDQAKNRVKRLGAVRYRWEKLR